MIRTGASWRPKRARKGLRLARIAAPGILLAGLISGAAAQDMRELLDRLPAGTLTEARGFEALAGWPAANHAGSFAVFQQTCLAALAGQTAPRPGVPVPASLALICRQAARLGALEPDNARRFFEAHFQPVEIMPGGSPGFMTGYYEPEVPGALTESPEFPAPLLARPDDLVTISKGTGVDAETSAGRRLPDGSVVPYPDRAAIGGGALGRFARPLVFVRDEVEAFFIHVQGSARVRLADGQVKRLSFAGRNGHAYTSIGRIIADEGHMRIEEMNLASIKAWLRADLGRGRAILQRNKSYIFFAESPSLLAEMGPIGGAGVPLTPWISIAVDNGIWPYGLPIWIEAGLPEPGGALSAFHALTIAADTGTAIKGPARIDLFHGWGEAAGELAGLVRHSMRFFALLPNRAGTVP